MPKIEFYELRPSVPIIRIFRARARQGCKEALADKLAISSVQAVRGQPGFLGFLAAGTKMSSDGVILQHRTKLIAHLIPDRSDNLLIGNHTKKSLSPTTGNCNWENTAVTM